jgi:hypothetical protein
MGEADASLLAVKQPDAGFVFELPQQAADGGLRGPHEFRRY